ASSRPNAARAAASVSAPASVSVPPDRSSTASDATSGDAASAAARSSEQSLYMSRSTRKGGSPPAQSGARSLAEQSAPVSAVPNHSSSSASAGRSARASAAAVSRYSEA